MSLKKLGWAIAVVVGMTPFSAVAVINCDTPHEIYSNTTLNDDYEKTMQTFGACIKINGSNTVVNMNGKSVRCRSTTGLCGPAINIYNHGGTVKNGNIIDGVPSGGGTARWNVGVQCFNDVQGFTDCEVSNMLIQAGATGIDGGRKVETTVFKNVNKCVDSGKALSSGGYYRRNFCPANNTGFALTGPASGNFTIERNFIRASTGTGIEIDSGSNVTVVQNIIDAATPAERQFHLPIDDN